MVAGGTFGSHFFGSRLLAVGVATCSTGVAMLSGERDTWWPTGNLMLAAGLVLTLVVVLRASRASKRPDEIPSFVTKQKHLILAFAGALPTALGFIMLGTDSATLALSVVPLLFWGHHAHRNGLGRTPAAVPCILAALFGALAFLAAGSAAAGFANTASGIIVGFALASTVALVVELFDRSGIADESTELDMGPGRPVAFRPER